MIKSTIESMVMSIVKNKIKYRLLRPLCESLGIDTYSRPALNELDIKLEKYLNFEKGVFLEVGANDGYKQSNTYYFEKMKKWRGVLIEPIPELYARCQKTRKRSEVFNYICSEPRSSGMTKTIRYADLMSQVKGSLKSNNKEGNHIKKGVNVQELDGTYEIDIECKTLSEVIEKSGYSDIDFMSIDVEGHELEALKGLDLERHTPKYLLIEIWPHEKEEIEEYLSHSYVIQEFLTGADVLFKRK